MDRLTALRVLGLKDGCTDKEVKHAYKVMAKRYHPDVNNGDKASEEKFKEINEAYTYLTNPNKSSKGEPSSSDIDKRFAQMFESIFAGGRFNSTFGPRSAATADKKPRPGTKPIRLGAADLGNYNLSFIRALFREPIKLRVSVQACCGECLGRADIWSSCSRCNQTGIISNYVRTPIGFLGDNLKCPACHGHGWVSSRQCPQCRGKLIYQKEKVIEFRPPEDLQYNRKLIIPKVGNESWIAENGDLYISLQWELPVLSNLSPDEALQLNKILQKAV